MNAAEALIQSAVMAGVEVCFANPGTTEMPLVNAMDAIPGIRAVLGLFEGVCTGAADGYGRMTGKPALTLLHHGPGLANGIANLHNARRAATPVVNLIGQHATWHIGADAPLTSDIEGLAHVVSAWVRTTRSAEDLPADGADAIAAASSFPGQVATLIAPFDCQAGEARGSVRPRPSEPSSVIPETRVSEVAGALRNSRSAAFLLGGRALHKPGLLAAARVAAAHQGKLFCPGLPARLERGAGLPAVEMLPYFPEKAIERLSSFDLLILAGAAEPVSFFGYPGLPSRVIPATCSSMVLARPEEDVLGALESLADLLPAKPNPLLARMSRPQRPRGPLTVRSLGEAIAAVQPEGLVLVDEALTSARPYFQFSAGTPPFTLLGVTGGSIGIGLPCAVGAAIACPQRKVLAFQADGSAMYTLQALWTQAREGLDVTTVICANRSYHILQTEMERAGLREPGRQAAALTELTRPALDWVEISRGLGVPAVRVETADSLVQQLEHALAEEGPHLIEAVL